ncbi:MAG: pseudouridine synthase [Acidobacteriota bacterium]
MENLKLQKFIQSSGFGSRREVRTMIADGEFTVNNKVVDDPNFLIDPEMDAVKHGNKRIKNILEKKVYFLFNKPLGVISTLKDPQGRVTITDFIKKIKERVYPVGRLDYNSEGLILLTNDGDLTNFIISPRNKIPKIYLIKIKGVVTPEQKEKLIKKGVFIDNRKVRALGIDFVKKTQTGNSWVRVTIVEGKKHIIRKMFQFSGHPVDRLRRVQIGNFSLRGIPSGQWRELTEDELNKFRKLYQLK